MITLIIPYIILKLFLADRKTPLLYLTLKVAVIMIFDRMANQKINQIYNNACQ